MNISCGLAPAQESPELATLAESLGYHRVWLYDSPALHADLWMTLARVAERTAQIAIGAGVLVPSLRHVMATAAAVATLEGLAPGRVAVGVGTGFTGRLMVGQRPMRWADVEAYVVALRRLLQGEETEVDGVVLQMLHPEGFVASRPMEVPIVVAANGPKGLQVAREVGDGVMSVMEPVAGFDWSVVAGGGTVLEPDEDPASERAVAAAGPHITMLYHYFYEVPGVSRRIEDLPGGAAWQANVDAIPESVRHLRLHETHMIDVSERDRPIVNADSLQTFTWTGTAEQLRARLDALQMGGATEVFYEPAGPDVRRELMAFAEMAGLERR